MLKYSDIKIAIQKIESKEQLKELIRFGQALGQYYVTNFELDEEKHKAWIETGEFQYEKFDDTLFLLFDHYSPDIEKYFTNLYYFSTSMEAMKVHLKNYPEMFIYDLYVLDFIGNEKACAPLMESIGQINSHVEAKLVRMCREGIIEDDPTTDERVKYAAEGEEEMVDTMLRENLNERVKKLPVVSEIKRMIAEKHVLKCVVEGQIAGMLLFDIEGEELHIQQRLTLSKYSNQGVGMALINRALYEGKDTKRQRLWVQEDNVKDIKRYEQLGFTKEDMCDYVVSYCGEPHPVEKFLYEP